MKKLLILLALLISMTSIGQSISQHYKVSLLRAKPGQLLELIDLIKSDLQNYEDFTYDTPYLLRHSQGDHWDLMIIYPIESMGTYFSENEVVRRRDSKTIEQAYGSDFFDLVSWQEEAIVLGPPKDAFEQAFSAYELFHIEIFTALAGKQRTLLKQREDENDYYLGINHRPNFIFTRVFGPSWDVFTIGWYEDLHDFAGPEIAFEVDDKAAKEAGFEGVNYIGSYLRSLILEHHDTLAWKVD